MVASGILLRLLCAILVAPNSDSAHMASITVNATLHVSEPDVESLNHTLSLSSSHDEDIQVESLKHSSTNLNTLYGGSAHHSPVYNRPMEKYSSYVQPIYTRVRLGYGTFYYNGRDAELRCHFPYNLYLVSNFVWNKVSDNLVHYLDSYRFYDRSYGHVSSLYIQDVMPKDFGIYSCAVTGSFYTGCPVTFYQEVHFYSPANYPLRYGKKN